MLPKNRLSLGIRRTGVIKPQNLTAKQCIFTSIEVKIHYKIVDSNKRLGISALEFESQFTCSGSRKRNAAG
jgi:hypothetical protein